MLMMPTRIPERIISFWLIIPVESAIALGGVLIGNIIALDAAMAMPISSVDSPPIAESEPPMPLPTMATIGTIKAAVAVLEIKLDSA